MMKYLFSVIGGIGGFIICIGIGLFVMPIIAIIVLSAGLLGLVNLTKEGCG